MNQLDPRVERAKEIGYRLFENRQEQGIASKELGKHIAMHWGKAARTGEKYVNELEDGQILIGFWGCEDRFRELHLPRVADYFAAQEVNHDCAIRLLRGIKEIDPFFQLPESTISIYVPPIVAVFPRHYQPLVDAITRCDNLTEKQVEQLESRINGFRSGMHDR